MKPEFRGNKNCIKCYEIQALRYVWCISYIAGIMTDIKCDTILSCGHKCLYTKATPHQKHKLSKCKQKCQKDLCSRGHKCNKLCGETCGPCKHPVKANLSCQHEALLPCCAVDRYQCQEHCTKVSQRFMKRFI